MKQMKFSGRELSVLRAIDFSMGSSGEEIVERTNIQPEEVLSVLSGLMEVGFVETTPPVEHVEPSALDGTKFEINPSYAHDLKEALKRR